jgi:HPt (histidine-containing phosphotransfer) domain-containing protein
VARLFLEDLSGRWSRLRRSIDLDDASEWKAQAHALKGSSISVGAMRLAKALLELEEMVIADARRALPRLEAEVQAVHEALMKEQRFSEPPAGIEVGR